MNKVLMWILIGLGILTIVFIALAFFSVAGKEEKPAIYLYPTEDSEIEVNLDINGKITTSIPKYERGWKVFATTEGIIDGQYDYLFYEADLKKLELPDKGWIVDYDNLDSWFELNLVKLGLNEKEKNQFKEYWMDRLPKANYYEIKILEDKFLKENMNLLINPVPDTLIRLNFYFKPLQEKKEIEEPIIITSIRKGFTVVEWGGMVG